MRVEDITEKHIQSEEEVTIKLDNGSLSSRVTGIMDNHVRGQGLQHTERHRSDCRNWVNSIKTVGTFHVTCTGQCLVSSPISRRDKKSGVYEVQVLRQEPGEAYTLRVVTFATGFTATYRVEKED